MKFSALLQYITPHRNTLLAIVALLLVESAVSLASPWLAGQLTGVVLGETDVLLTSINWILVAWLGLMVIKSLLSFASQYLVGSTGQTMAASLRTRIYQHMQV